MHCFYFVCNLRDECRGCFYPLLPVHRRAPRFSPLGHSFLLPVHCGDSFTHSVDDLLTLMSYILWWSSWPDVADYIQMCTDEQKKMYPELNETKTRCQCKDKFTIVHVLQNDQVTEHQNKRLCGQSYSFSYVFKMLASEIRKHHLLLPCFQTVNLALDKKANMVVIAALASGHWDDELKALYTGIN